MRESDWKKFKHVRALALQRFCEKVLLDLQSKSSDTRKSAHERYLDIYSWIDERNESMSYMFDDSRRSNALYQLDAMHSNGLVTEEEIADFGEEIRKCFRTRV